VADGAQGRGGGRVPFSLPRIPWFHVQVALQYDKSVATAGLFARD
jgi:hypothetical protein